MSLFSENLHIHMAAFIICSVMHTFSLIVTATVIESNAVSARDVYSHE